jgi:chemotaxis protein CheC
MDLRTLDAAQLDALREVANIGAAHAATALSQIARRRVMITVPDIRIVRLEEVDRIVGEPAAVVAAVMMKILGDATGRTVQIFHGDAAARLASTVLGTPPPAFPDGFDDVHQSALMEICNIVVGAHLTALSDFMGMLLITSAPAATVDMAGAVMTTSYLNFGSATDEVFCMNTELIMDDDKIHADFLFIPDDVSLGVILRQLKLV